MKGFVPVDDVFAAQLRELDAQYTVFNSLKSIRPQVGALRRIEVGQLTTLVDPTRDGQLYYNRILGLEVASVDRLDEAAAHFDGAYWIEMPPRDAVQPRVQAALDRLGARYRGSMSWFRAVPARQPVGLPDGLHIRPVTPETVDDVFRFIELGGSGPISAEIRESRAQYFCTPDFVNYLVYDGDDIVSGGAIFIRGQHAILGNAFTVEGHRGRGLQTATLRHRLNVAADLGLEWVATDTVFTGSSRRNVERAGFSLAFQTVIVGVEGRAL